MIPFFSRHGFHGPWGPFLTMNLSSSVQAASAFLQVQVWRCLKSQSLHVLKEGFAQFKKTIACIWGWFRWFPIYPIFKNSPTKFIHLDLRVSSILIPKSTKPLVNHSQVPSGHDQLRKGIYKPVLFGITPQKLHTKYPLFSHNLTLL